jgi:hypothetical protein
VAIYTVRNIPETSIRRRSSVELADPASNWQILQVWSPILALAAIAGTGFADT